MKRTNPILLCVSSFVVFLVSLNSSTALAEVASEISVGENSRVELVSELDALVPGQAVNLGLLITLNEGWHTYWSNSGDSGAAPKVRWKASEAGFKASALEFPLPERIETGPIITFGFHGEPLLRAKIQVPESAEVGATIEVSARGEYLVCADVCLQAKFDVSKSFPVRAAGEAQTTDIAAKFESERAREWTSSPWKFTRSETNKVTVLSIAVPEADRTLAGFSVEEFFPTSESGLTSVKPKITRSSPKEIRLEFEKTDIEPTDLERAGVLAIRVSSKSEAQVVRIANTDVALPALEVPIADANSGSANTAAAKTTSPVSSPGIVWVLFSAFLGGLILNLMPCVFPIISMKLLSLLKQSGSTTSVVRKHNLAYAAGVVASFVVIALTLAGLRSSGEAVGWGFQLQSPYVVTAMAYLFVALSLNFLGAFEFNLPGAGFGQGLASREGLSGAFFTGVLSVVVASPCTAPFMGASLGFAISQPLPILLSIFVFLGLGLAAPYLVFAIFPAAAKKLPKPGVWMKTIKELMAFPMIATAIWLLWVLANLVGQDAAFSVAGALLLFAVALWLPGKGPRNGFAKVFTIVVVFALIVGSLILAQAQMSELVKRDVDGVQSNTGLRWESFSEEKLASLRREKKTVFVNFTAAWCLTCKVNEKVTFANQEVRDLVASKNIVMIKADWTHSDPAITRILEAHGRIGVPFYLLFANGAEPTALPELLTPDLFKSFVTQAVP